MSPPPRRSLRSRPKLSKTISEQSEEEEDDISSGSDFEQEMRMKREKRRIYNEKMSDDDDDDDDSGEYEEGDGFAKSSSQTLKSKKPTLPTLKKSSNKADIKGGRSLVSSLRKKINSNQRSDLPNGNNNIQTTKVVPSSFAVPGVSSLALSESDSESDSDSERTEAKNPKIESHFNLMQVSNNAEEDKALIDDKETKEEIHSQLEALAQSHQDDLKPWGAEVDKPVDFKKTLKEEDDIKLMLKQQESNLNLEDDDNDGDTDGEDVHNDRESNDEGTSQEVKGLEGGQSKSIEVMVEYPENVVSSKKRKEFDMKAYLKRKLQKALRDRQEWMHKTHILCLMAHLKHVQSCTLSKTILQAIALSLVPKAHWIVEKKKHNMMTLRATLDWFVDSFPVFEKGYYRFQTPSIMSLVEASAAKSVCSIADLVFLFLLILRSLQWKVRLVMNLGLVPLKLPKQPETKTSTSIKSSKSSKKERIVEGEEDDSVRLKSPDKNQAMGTKSNRRKKKTDQEAGTLCEPPVKKGRSSMKQNNEGSNDKDVPKRSKRGLRDLNGKTSNGEATPLEEKESGPNRNISEVSTNRPTRKASISKSRRIVCDDDDDDDFKSVVKRSKVPKGSIRTQSSRQVSTLQSTSKTRRSSARQSARKKTSYREIGSEDESTTKLEADRKKGSPVKLTEEAMREIESRKKPKDRDKSIYARKMKADEGDIDDGYVDESQASSKKGGKRKTCGSKDQPCSQKNAYWLEVFDEQKKLWICVDVLKKKIDCPSSLAASLYVIAVDDNARLKDVTRRYRAKDFMTTVRQQRVSGKWFEDALKPFLMKVDKREEIELDKALSEQPFPTNMAAFKNHPLFVLPRHLLKFEAIYPPDAPTLHFFRGEPVYARECVHTLHCRVTWLKEGRVVRVNEQPYKVVKGRPKWDRMTASIVTGQPLEVFGRWQTELYVPPPAEDGKVPRNEYGNVELFKPWMLPKGTVHVPIGGINRVAKKLNIDCAPAMIGWDFHCSGVHPVFDGFVVCQEHEQLLLEAWQQDQEAKEKRERDRREKRVLDNWKKLVKGMLIHQRIKLKYGSQKR